VHALPEGARLVGKKKKEINHSKEMTKAKPNEDVF